MSNMGSIMFLAPLVAFLIHVASACNPLTTNGCPPIPGLASSTYSVDFTKQESLPSDWILANAANVTFSTSKGAAFNFNKRKDAPYVWTNFYVAYGRIDVEMQVASGTGVITSAVMYSDDADEIDWEFSGSNLGAGIDRGMAQTNVFAKGITGNYDRGTLQDVSPVPQTTFHTYSIEWTPDTIDWIIDGVKKFTTTNNKQTTGNYQFPQTPSRLHIGMWDAGDPDTAEGTRAWAGGLTDYSKCPYVAYVKTVKITTPYPCKSWKYPDNFSGKWSDVKCTNETIPGSDSVSATTSSATPKSTAAIYSVVAGDNGYSIADKLGCTFDQLSKANPGVRWDFLNIGQLLSNPNVVSVAGTTTSSSRPNSTSATAALAPSTTAGPIVQPSCHLDECFNSLTATQFSSSAINFCSSYNKTTSLAIPTYLNGCSGNATRVKSACSCFYGSHNMTTSAAVVVLPTSDATHGPSTGGPTRGLSSSSHSSSSTSKVTSSTTTSTIHTTSSNAGWSNWQNAGSGWNFWGSKSSQNGKGWKRNDPSQDYSDSPQFGRMGARRQHP